MRKFNYSFIQNIRVIITDWESMNFCLDFRNFLTFTSRRHIRVHCTLRSSLLDVTAGLAADAECGDDDVVQECGSCWKRRCTSWYCSSTRWCVTRPSTRSATSQRPALVFCPARRKAPSSGSPSTTCSALSPVSQPISSTRSRYLLVVHVEQSLGYVCLSVKYLSTAFDLHIWHAAFDTTYLADFIEMQFKL